MFLLRTPGSRVPRQVRTARGKSGPTITGATGVRDLANPIQRGLVIAWFPRCRLGSNPAAWGLVANPLDERGLVMHVRPRTSVTWSPGLTALTRTLID